MSETFEEWLATKTDIKEGGNPFKDLCIRRMKDPWNHQQAKIDQLEKKCAEYEEALSSVRKIIKYPWSVFEPPLVAIDIVDKALNRSEK